MLLITNQNLRFSYSLNQIFLWLLVASFVLAFLFDSCETRARKKPDKLIQRMKRNIPKKVGPVKTDLMNSDDTIKNENLTITHLHVGVSALVYTLDLAVFSYDTYDGIKKGSEALLELGIFLSISLLTGFLPLFFIPSTSNNSKTIPISTSISISSPYTRNVSSMIGMPEHWFEEIFYISSLCLFPRIFE
jgi:hypothetical protein